MQFLRTINRVRLTISTPRYLALPADALTILEDLAAEKRRRRHFLRLFFPHCDWPRVRAVLYGLGYCSMIPAKLR